jgi:uncharacterized protein YqgV (UPF0045/DUF77 family)
MRCVEKIASCEVSFIPIQTNDYISYIERVLEIIRASGLEHTVGLLSTTVRGEKSKVLSLIRDIYQSMDEVCSFTMEVKISNICGCK